MSESVIIPQRLLANELLGMIIYLNAEATIFDLIHFLSS